MTQGYNATDAIFFGFRLFQRDPLLVAGFVVLTTVTTLAGMQLVWPDLVAFSNAINGLSTTAADPQEVLAAYALLATPGMAADIVLSVLVGLVIQAAAIRVLAFDRRGGWFWGLQLAADEARLLAISFVYWLLCGVAWFGFWVAIVIVAAIFSVVHPALAALVAVVGGIAGIVFLLLVFARLSLAAPATVAEGKLVLFGSWRMTRGRGWGVLGAYVVLFFIIIVAALAVFAVSSLIAPQATAMMQGMTTPGEGGGAAFLSPGYIVATLLNSIVNVASAIAFTGVGVYVYRMLGREHGYMNALPLDGGATVAETFE